jgi:hypothetical protein
VVLGHVEHLRHGVPAVLAHLRVGIRAVDLAPIVDGLEQLAHPVHERAARVLDAEAREPVAQREDRLHGRWVDPLDLACAPERLDDRDALRGREPERLLERALPDAARRTVDDPQERGLVVRVRARRR